MSFFLFLRRSFVLLFFCAMIGSAAIRWLEVAIEPVVWGVGIGYGNALIGFAILRWGFHKSHQLFMISIYGGMILRFLLIFSLIFLLIVAFKMDTVTFLVSLMGSYFIFLGLEVFQISQITVTQRDSK